MQLKRYIKLYDYSVASLAAEGIAFPVYTEGLYRTIMYARNSETKEERGFWGSSFYYEDEGAEGRTRRLERATELMVDAFKKSDIYNNGNCEIGSYLTRKWEQINDLSQKQLINFLNSVNV